MAVKRFEDHFDFNEAHRRTGLSVSKLRILVKSGEIDPVVEIPGEKMDVAKVLIPSSSMAKYLAKHRVTRKPEGIIA